MLDLPPIQKKHVNPAWPKQAAANIRQAVEQLPPETEVKVEGFTVRRVGGNSESCFFVHSDYSAHQPIRRGWLCFGKAAQGQARSARRKRPSPVSNHSKRRLSRVRPRRNCRLRPDRLSSVPEF